MKCGVLQDSSGKDIEDLGFSHNYTATHLAGT